MESDSQTANPNGKSGWSETVAADSSDQAIFDEISN